MRRFAPLLILLPWLLLPNSIWAQHRRTYYDLTVKNKEAGVLIVDYQSDASGREFIRVYTDLRVELLFSVHLIFDLRATYHHGHLFRARSRVIKNGKPHSRASFWHEDEQRMATLEGDTLELDTSSISYSSALLYVQEPKGLDLLYSEVNATFNPVCYSEGGCYEVRLPYNNQSNEYCYENGEMISGELGHWLAPIQIRRRE